MSDGEDELPRDTWNDQLLDLDAVCRLIGGSKPVHPATVWRGVKAGRYPKPIQVSAKLRRWRRSKLVEAIAAAERGEAAPQA